jgi:hypothetical protein
MMKLKCTVLCPHILEKCENFPITPYFLLFNSSQSYILRRLALLWKIELKIYIKVFLFFI